MKLNKISYFAILVILAGTTLLYFRSSNNEIKSFALNLTTEILGIIITVFLIDYAIKHREKQEKTKILKSGYLQFRRALEDMLDYLVKMYKASCKDKPSDISNRYFEILQTDEFFQSISYLDFMKVAPIAPKRNWAMYSADTIKSFRKKLDKIIDKYNFVLDSQIISEIEGISNSKFLQMLDYAQVLHTIDKSNNFSRETLPILATGDDEYIRSFIGSLADLNRHFGLLAKEDFTSTYDTGIWLESFAPKLGNARIEVVKR